MDARRRWGHGPGQQTSTNDKNILRIKGIYAWIDSTIQCLHIISKAAQTSHCLIKTSERGEITKSEKYEIFLVFISLFSLFRFRDE